MTNPALTYPLATEDALQHLRDALGANYAGAVDTPTLERALSVDAVTVADLAHLRPWATARRLIMDNTEYEVNKGLQARIDRKLQGLLDRQAQADDAAGITAYVPQSATSGAASVPASGAQDVQAVF